MWDNWIQSLRNVKIGSSLDLFSLIVLVALIAGSGLIVFIVGFRWKKKYRPDRMKIHDYTDIFFRLQNQAHGLDRKSPSRRGVGEESRLGYLVKAVEGNDLIQASEIAEELKSATPDKEVIRKAVAFLTRATPRVYELLSSVLMAWDKNLTIPVLGEALLKSDPDTGDRIASILSSLEDERVIDYLIKFSEKQQVIIDREMKKILPFQDISVYLGEEIVTSPDYASALSELEKVSRSTFSRTLMDIIENRDGNRDQKLIELSLIVLGKVGTGEAASFLADKLSSFPANVRNIALESIKEIGEPKALEKALNFLIPGEESGDGKEHDVRRLLDGYQSGDEYSRLSILSSLSRKIVPEAKTLIVQALNDPAKTVRYAALEIIYRSVDKFEVDPVLKLANDPAPMIRKLYARTLNRFGVKNIDELLRPLLEDEDESVREEVKKILVGR